MDGPNASSYREWDEQADNSWFRCGRRPAPVVMDQVRPLTKEYASQLWHWVFASDKEVLPLVAKYKKSWLNGVFAGKPIWYGGEEPRLGRLMRRLFPWPNADPVFFLTRLGTGYQSPWRVYAEHCESFLGWYNEGLLFHPTLRNVAVFWEISAVFVGRRSKRRLDMRSSN